MSDLSRGLQAMKLGLFVVDGCLEYISKAGSDPAELVLA
jgi:hypothetical protein